MYLFNDKTLNVGVCFLLAPFSLNNPNNISILNTYRYNFLRTTYGPCMANEVCLCVCDSQDVCEGKMALKPMPNDVKPEAKTLNQSPLDIEHYPKQSGRADCYVYVFVFTMLLKS